MKMQLAYYGDPVLRKKGARIEGIDDDLRQLVIDMYETMKAHNGIGLAAPQVHRSLTLFITQVPFQLPNGSWKHGDVKVYINPKIIEVSEETITESEGCVSIPKLYVDVARPVRVKIQAHDLQGNEFIEEYSDLEARCVLHENDHINGVLNIDRVHGKQRKEIEDKLREIKKKYYLKET